MIQRAYSDNTTLTSTFDADGRLTGGDGLALSYDKAGRITQSNGIAIARDQAGRILAITYATGKTARYTYNNRGLLTTCNDWNGGATQFTYDDAGELVSTTFPNGVQEARTYDKDGRVATIVVSGKGKTISSTTLHRNAAGQVTSEDRSAPSIPDAPAGYLPMAYDSAEQSFGATYDALGRVTTDVLRTYSWDLASRLAS